MRNFLTSILFICFQYHPVFLKTPSRFYLPYYSFIQAEEQKTNAVNQRTKWFSPNAGSIFAASPLFVHVIKRWDECLNAMRWDRGRETVSGVCLYSLKQILRAWLIFWGLSTFRYPRCWLMDWLIGCNLIMCVLAHRWEMRGHVWPLVGPSS